jgi:hypothetical protein
MKINMDKYKTSQLGQALKKVYRGTMEIEDSVKLAESEIAEVFAKKEETNLSIDSETGFFGDVVAKCPLCGKNVIRGNKSYGCIGYKEGCEFRLGLTICKKTIPINEVARLLATGETAKMRGFISKNGKSFDGKLALQDGKAVFKF